MHARGGTQKRGRRYGKVLCMLNEFILSAEKVLLRGSDKSMEGLYRWKNFIDAKLGRKITDAMN